MYDNFSFWNNRYSYNIMKIMNNFSPIKHRLKVIGTEIASRVFPNRIIYEALVCHNSRLPKVVKVSWEREKDGFIVGKIVADDYELVAQGKNAKDFIETVNDAIFAACEIPSEYMVRLGGYNRFYPKPDQLEKLKDKSIEKHSFGIVDNKKPAPAN